MKVFSIEKYIIEPESGNPEGLTQLHIWLTFQGRDVYFNETIEGIHPKWADDLVAELKGKFE